MFRARSVHACGWFSGRVDAAGDEHGDAEAVRLEPHQGHGHSAQGHQAAFANLRSVSNTRILEHHTTHYLLYTINVMPTSNTCTGLLVRLKLGNVL